MITVHFHGSLKPFGEQFTLEARSPAEVVRALTLQIPGLAEAIRAGNWHILRGRLDEQDDVDEEALEIEFGTQTEMHMMPAIEGANSGALSVIVGVVLIAVGVFFPPSAAIGAAMIGGGIGMALGGIVMMTTQPPPAAMNRESVDERASFLFDGTTNSTTQGPAIPRGYGKCLVGSSVISASVVAEQLLDGANELNSNSGFPFGD